MSFFNLIHCASLRSLFESTINMFCFSNSNQSRCPSRLDIILNSIKETFAFLALPTNNNCLYKIYKIRNQVKLIVLLRV
jgi:hypothetical protein